MAKFLLMQFTNQDSRATFSVHLHLFNLVAMSVLLNKKLLSVVLEMNDSKDNFIVVFRRAANKYVSEGSHMTALASHPSELLAAAVKILTYTSWG